MTFFQGPFFVHIHEIVSQTWEGILRFYWAVMSSYVQLIIQAPMTWWPERQAVYVYAPQLRAIFQVNLLKSLLRKCYSMLISMVVMTNHSHASFGGTELKYLEHI